MKSKNWLYPLVLIVSVAAIVASLFFPFFQEIEYAGATGSVLGSYGIFYPFFNSTAFTLTAYTGIWGTLSLIALIVGAVGLLASLVLTVFKASNKGKFNYKKWNLASVIVALVGLVAIITFAGLFMGLNYEGDATAYDKIIGASGLFIAFAGLLIGVVASFLSANDLLPERVKKAKEEPKVEVEKTIEVAKPKTTSKPTSTAKVSTAKKTTTKKATTTKTTTKPKTTAKPKTTTTTAKKTTKK